MSTEDTRFAWWSRLRHSGLLLSPVVQIEKYAEAPEEPKWYQPEKLRTSYNRFLASIDRSKDRPQLAQGDILTWLDALLEKYIGHEDQRLSRSHNIPESLTAVIRIGSRTETLRPDRVLFAEDGKTPLLLIKADTSPHIGRGKGRTEYSRFLELLRGCGHRLGLLTNGLQFRLVYAGLDFESWCEWESERWFEDTEGTEELLGLRQILFPTQITDNKGEVIGAGLPGLLTAIEESRKRQADLSQVLRENVRQAVEMLLEDVSNACRTDADLFNVLVSPPKKENTASDKHLTDAESQEALLQATVRVVMRMVVCLFAESRGLLRTGDPIYGPSYGVRTLYELLDETVRHEGSQLGLMTRQSAWARLMATFRLIHGGSEHGNFTLRPYGGALFRPGAADADDPVSRALFILEHKVNVNDATIFRVLRKLLRGPLPVLRGRSKTYVEGPVDYTELRTEFIGLIYEGLLDYRVKRTTEEIGPQVFLKLGRQPVLPLSRLESMLEDDPNSLKDLFTKLKKESVAATVESDDEAEESDDDSTEAEESEEPTDELSVEVEEEEEVADQTYLDALQAARRWARQAIIATKLIGQQRARETDTEFDQRIEVAIDELIDRVVAPGEFYLVRAGNNRKGTGTFYTRPQLAVPTVHRTLEPLCFDKDDKGVLTPKKPEEILALKVCDPACGSASFLVAALHYLTDALYKSLCFHCGLDDPKRAAKITLPFGTPSTGKDSDATVPLPPDDPNRGEEFSERVQALLRRHIVERCIYGVDINPLAVEFARVSLWVETLDPELPFSFLDHKVKIGNALVGCWVDEVEHYPIRAWERNGGDDQSASKKGERTLRIETYLNGERVGNRRSGRGVIKRELKELLESRFSKQTTLFENDRLSIDRVVTDARKQYESLHSTSIREPDEQERHYRQKIEGSETLQRLKQAMDEWCSVWFWSTNESLLSHVPTPLSFHADDDSRAEIVRSLQAAMKFFHWELEFPDVFSGTRWGFDAVVGNPPWETSQPDPYEFFCDYDPLIRTFSRIELLKRMSELFDEVEQLEEEWFTHCGFFKAFSNWISFASDPFGHRKDSPNPLGRGDEHLVDRWKQHRQERLKDHAISRPFQLQVGRVFTYKLFFEKSYYLLSPRGRIGIIVPAGIYSDAWSLPLRELLSERSQWEWLYSFENKKRIFDIHGSFKFCCVIAKKLKDITVPNLPLRTAFMIHEIAEWEKGDPRTVDFNGELIDIFSPRSKSIPEIRTGEDLSICRRVYANSFRIGDDCTGWNITFSLEFMMNTHAKLFPSCAKWQANGFTKNEFEQWVNSDGEIAYPLMQGGVVNLYDPLFKGWESGQGRSATWTFQNYDNKQLLPKFIISEGALLKFGIGITDIKVGFRNVTRATDARSFISSVVFGLGCGNSLPVLRCDNDIKKTTLLAAATSSFSFDFVVRQRLAGVNLNWFICEELPLPKSLSDCEGADCLIRNTFGLSLVHRRFAPLWEYIRHCDEQVTKLPWKHNWLITQSDRLRARVENEAICASAFGLSADQFNWLLRDDRNDPKGFWRVDKDLPYEERLTGLSARAFRAMKEGKWSAETVAQLSNDEFFDLLGIPELTNAKSAEAKGLSGPLILKRDGCHSWHPENFPADDPRHGWTWEDCRKDAITLLGSEEALEAYIAQATATGEDDDGEDEEPFQLKSDPPKKKPQQRLF
jgi:hypothetical protein